LPFIHLTLKTPKPLNPAHPEELNTLGDHIRKRRLDLGMHQKDVAALVNATTSTVTNWEKNRTCPTLEFLPRILSFLGYDPSSDHAATLGEKIKRYRRINGLSIKKLAQQLGIYQGTLARCEKGQAMQIRPFQRVLISLLKNMQ